MMLHLSMFVASHFVLNFGLGAAKPFAGLLMGLNVDFVVLLAGGKECDVYKDSSAACNELYLFYILVFAVVSLASSPVFAARSCAIYVEWG
jgi:hypothetical protein